MCQGLKEERKLSCGLGGGMYSNVEKPGEFQRTETGVLFIYKDKPWRTQVVCSRRSSWSRGGVEERQGVFSEMLYWGNISSFLCLTENYYS